MARMNLNLSSLRANSGYVERWLDDASPPVRSVEFGTFSELWCQAQFYRVAVVECSEDLRAFTCVWRRYLEHTEQFEIRSAHLDLFLASFTANTGYGKAAVFEPLTEALWIKETSLVTEGIRKELAEVRRGQRLVHGKRVQIPEGPLDLGNTDSYWGIFEDRQRLPDSSTFEFLAPEAFADGVAIRREWNDQQLFIKTTSEYVLFVWGTGA